MPNQNRLIADASFYLVFLKDINKPHFLKKIVCGHDFHITPLVDGEVKKKLKEFGMGYNYSHITNNPITKVANVDVSIASVIAPLFGETALKYGEHEVVAHSYELADLNIHFSFLIDELGARGIVQTHLPHLMTNMKWTSTFICECKCNSKSLSQQECFELINEMKQVNSLKVPAWKWALVEQRIQSC